MRQTDPTKKDGWIVNSLFLALVVYSGLDVYQTKLLLDLGAVEMNPILHKLVETTGTWLIIPFLKLFFIAMLAFFLRKREKKIAKTDNSQQRRD